jgi:hypothetical protein
VKFDLSKCFVREARKTDREDLIRVSRGIWGGTDYLPLLMDRWIAEPWFLVCEYLGKVIGCLKLSLFPDKVLWFEGLRVQKRFQNHGVASLLNRHSYVLAEKLLREGTVQSFEFCTYYKNLESLPSTQKFGFKAIDGFYVLEKRGVKATREPQSLPLRNLEPFRHYGNYIPCAWQSLHHCDESLAFLQSYGRIIQTPHASYYVGGAHEQHVILLEPPTPAMKNDFPYLQHLFGSRKSYNIILPPAFKDSLPLLHELGFRFWDCEPLLNMLVLRK